MFLHGLFHRLESWVDIFLEGLADGLESVVKNNASGSDTDAESLTSAVSNTAKSGDTNFNSGLFVLLGIFIEPLVVVKPLFDESFHLLK
jgi:hypothetical protein